MSARQRQEKGKKERDFDHGGEDHSWLIIRSELIYSFAKKREMGGGVSLLILVNLSRG